MTRVRVRVPLTALVLAPLLLLALSWWDGRVGTEDARTIAAARNALAAGTAYRREQARLLAIAQVAGARAEQHRREAEVKDRAVHRLEGALAVARTAQDSVGVLLLEVDTLKAQVADWRSAYAGLIVKVRADSTRADRAEARVTLLQQNLAATLRVADCHILGLSFFPRCPSRTLSFGLGAVAGVVAILVVK